ncbi:hypothetical protein [Profundibacter sp.]|uniref:hypothetical protein n=1 Tax=Profundibacter sp. TaxID=3101071 RepID=UPI003D12C61A
MGDFEDVFGAGADAVDIIDGYNREYLRETRKQKLETANSQDGQETWRASMFARGYTQGPLFSSFEELSNWDRTNERPHVRRRTSDGFEVFFTDSKDFASNDKSETPSINSSTANDDSEIPF